MSLLNVSDLSFTTSTGTTVFSGVSFSIDPGEKIGLAGPNGAGKSTLLCILGGKLEAGGGRIVSRSGIEIACLVEQPGAAGRESLIEAVLGGRPRLAELRRRLEQLEGLEYAELLDAYASEGGYEWEAEVERVLDGLGFDEAARGRPLEELSSGERVRGELARCLVSNAELLLLDEPTNHLDLARRAWLEEHLVGMEAACVVVSHDRALLNGVAERMLVLERGQMRGYAGNYEDYRAERAVEERQSWQAYEGQQRRAAAAVAAAERRARLASRVAAPPEGVRAGQDFYRRKAAKVARTARLLRERVSREEQVVKPWEEQPIPPLRFANVPRSGGVLLRAEGLGKSYGGRRLFTGLSFAVRSGERWAVLGANGSGKTTLLRILAGAIEAEDGAVYRGSGTRIGWYAQESENLDLERSAVEICRDAGAEETAARTLLGCLRLAAERVNRPLATLSAGERAKAALARLLLSEVNLLLLDEPTNHLDLEAIEALDGALRQFPGAIVFASHDRWLIQRLATAEIRVADERG